MGRVHRLFLDDRPETLGIIPPPAPPRLSTTASKRLQSRKLNLFDSLGAAHTSDHSGTRSIPRHIHQHQTPSLNSQTAIPVAAASAEGLNHDTHSLLHDKTPIVKILSCRQCGTHLSHNGNNNLISKDFHGHHGKAWLMRTVFNTVVGDSSTRSMTTGVHVVADIDCVSCGTTVGWKYIKAMELSQRYKEGCFIVEVPLVTMRQADI
ncbi:hypothetical protein HDU80_011531 [Chytriomyces hyalinus]|nr:hypothetical protein HDU80_011531 [Chytriomyces hyalinus]